MTSDAIPTSNGAYEALIMVLVAHSAIPALIILSALGPLSRLNEHFVNGLLSL